MYNMARHPPLSECYTILQKQVATYAGRPTALLCNCPYWTREEFPLFISSTKLLNCRDKNLERGWNINSNIRFHFDDKGPFTNTIKQQFSLEIKYKVCMISSDKSPRCPERLWVLRDFSGID